MFHDSNNRLVFNSLFATVSNIKLDVKNHFVSAAHRYTQHHATYMGKNYPVPSKSCSLNPV